MGPDRPDKQPGCYPQDIRREAGNAHNAQGNNKCGSKQDPSFSDCTERGQEYNEQHSRHFSDGLQHPPLVGAHVIDIHQEVVKAAKENSSGSSTQKCAKKKD